MQSRQSLSTAVRFSVGARAIDHLPVAHLPVAHLPIDHLKVPFMVTDPYRPYRRVTIGTVAAFGVALIAVVAFALHHSPSIAGEVQAGNASGFVYFPSPFPAPAGEIEPLPEQF